MTAQGARYAHPDQPWFTLESRHFLAHYPADLEDQARRFLSAAERHHRSIEQRLHWRPVDKTTLIVTDYSDYANGWATPLPRNRILVHVTRPDEILGLEDYRDWPSLLLTHEYVHTIHLDKAEDFSYDLRRILGRVSLLFPNLYQPRWILEGLATDWETDEAGGYGRGQSSYFRALMRMEVEGGLKSYRQLSLPFASWPSGVAPYLYGVMMTRHLRRHYGDQRLYQFIERTSAQPLPFLAGLNFRPVFGQDLKGLWAEFTNEARIQAKEALAPVERDGEVSGTPLTRSGYFTGQPRVGPNGLWLILDDQIRPKRLAHRDDQGRWQEIAEVYGRVRLDVHPLAGVLMSQLAITDSVLLHQDLYRWEENGPGRLRRLTRDGRYRRAVWSPDGRRIAAVRQKGGHSTLELLGADGRYLETLWKGEEAVLAGLDWAPDGSHIIAALWRPERGWWDLARLDLESRRWTLITDDAVIQAHPRYTPDGTLFYSADHGGRYDIYRIPPGERRRERLTRVRGGAFEPDYAPHTDTLYYTGLTPGGQQVFALDHPHPLEEAPLPPPKPWQESPLANASALSLATPRPYHPWPRVRPTYWLPLWELTPQRNLLGATWGGGDDLDRHRYLFGWAVDTVQKVMEYQLSYQYEPGFIQWTVNATRNHLDYQDRSGRLIGLRATQRLTVEAVRPWLHTDHRLLLGTAGQYQREWDVRSSAPAGESHSLLLGSGLSWQSTRRQSLSLIGYDGHTVTILAEMQRENEREGARLHSQIQWTSRPFLGRHALRARAVMGRTFGDIRPFELGGYLPGLGRNSPFAYGRYRYRLPGHPAGLAENQGDRLQLARLSWHFPLKEVERGLMLPPIGLQRLHGDLYLAGGRTWFSGDDAPRWRKTVGIEVNVDAHVGFNIPIKVKVGLAVGIGPYATASSYLDWQLPLW